MIDDSGTINTTLPSLAFENSIHNPFLDHINSSRSTIASRTARKDATRVMKKPLFPFRIPITTRIVYCFV